MPSLNIRQSRFVAEYIKTGNATQSAIAAGYSPKTAHVQGHDLLRNPKLIGFIAASVAIDEVSIQRWKAEVARFALTEKPTDDFTHDHKAKYVDLLGKHLGALRDAPAVGITFAIQINLGETEHGTEPA